MTREDYQAAIYGVDWIDHLIVGTGYPEDWSDAENEAHVLCKLLRAALGKVAAEQNIEL